MFVPLPYVSLCDCLQLLHLLIVCSLLSLWSTHLSFNAAHTLVYIILLRYTPWYLLFCFRICWSIAFSVSILWWKNCTKNWTLKPSHTLSWSVFDFLWNVKHLCGGTKSCICMNLTDGYALSLNWQYVGVAKRCISVNGLCEQSINRRMTMMILSLLVHYYKTQHNTVQYHKTQHWQSIPFSSSTYRTTISGFMPCFRSTTIGHYHQPSSTPPRGCPFLVPINWYYKLLSSLPDSLAKLQCYHYYHISLSINLTIKTHHIIQLSSHPLFPPEHCIPQHILNTEHTNTNTNIHQDTRHNIPQDTI